MLSGSCLCGQVGFECDAPTEIAYNCYCGRCRKARGAAFASNLFVPISSFRWTRGEDLLKTFRPPDAERFANAFCSACGSCLPVANPIRGVVGIPMGSLDGDPGISPRAHIFVGSKSSWAEISDSKPQFEGPIDSQRLDSNSQ